MSVPAETHYDIAARPVRLLAFDDPQITTDTWLARHEAFDHHVVPFLACGQLVRDDGDEVVLAMNEHPFNTTYDFVLCVPKALLVAPPPADEIPPVATVWWRDAHAVGENGVLTAPKDFYRRWDFISAGFLVRNDPAHVAVAQWYCPATGKFKNITIIPTATVQVMRIQAVGEHYSAAAKGDFETTDGVF